VSESLHQFTIVEDWGFKSLMKTGRPEYYIPSKSTVSHDVRLVFANVRKHMAKMMQVSRYYTQNLAATILNIMPQEYEGNLNFVTDAWTLPNHKSFVAISVHFEHKGKCKEHCLKPACSRERNRDLWATLSEESCMSHCLALSP
jgi:hypothetical protein